MGRLVDFHVTGFGQLNGNLRIDKTVQMDDDLANRLRTSKPALLEFVNVHYPGAKVVENSLTIRILPIKVQEPPKELPSQKSKVDNSEKVEKTPKKNNRSESSKTDGIRSEVEILKLKNEAEKEKLKSKIENEKLNAELNQVRLQNRQANLDRLKNAYKDEPKNILYYAKLIWIYLDRPWKKVIALYLISYTLFSFYKYVSELF